MDHITTKYKIENLTIFLGFSILWLAIGSILLAQQCWQIGGLFIGAAGTISIVLILGHKKERINLQSHIAIQDRMLYAIIAIGSIGLAITAPYIMAFSSIIVSFLRGE